MKAILTAHNLASDLVTSIWTPVFVGIFLAIVAYALWPRNQAGLRRGIEDAVAGGLTDHGRA